MTDPNPLVQDIEPDAMHHVIKDILSLQAKNNNKKYKNPTLIIINRINVIIHFQCD